MFTHSGQDAAQDGDPWEKGNKWGKLYDYHSLLAGENFQATAQGGVFTWKWVFLIWGTEFRIWGGQGS